MLYLLHKSLKLCFVLAATLVLLAACWREGKVDAVVLDNEPSAQQVKPNAEAMRRLEGIWLDAQTESVILKVRGDSIFYPDSTDLPARFIIYDDTLLVFGPNNMRYPILKQGQFSFDYVNLQGDVVHLVRSDNPDDSLIFEHRHYAPMLIGELVKRDTVVFAPSGQRYHLYIDVNPTSRKVFSSSYTDDGMAVQQVYFDNIIHISVYTGRDKVFSRDIDKRLFEDLIPKEFLEGAILSNMEWGRTDNSKTVFHATVCEPEGARCYVVDLLVGFDGKLNTMLTEY